MFSKAVNVLKAVDASICADAIANDYHHFANIVEKDEKDDGKSIDIDTGLSTAQYVWLREQLVCEWSLQTILTAAKSSNFFPTVSSFVLAKEFINLFSKPPPLQHHFLKVWVKDDWDRVYLCEWGLVNHWRQKCLYCDKIATLRCGGCQRAWFCSNECQQRTWSYHKSSCTLLHPNISKLSRTIFQRLITLTCPRLFKQLIHKDRNHNRYEDAYDEEYEQTYARLFARRLPEWEFNIELNLLNGLINDLSKELSTVKEMKDVKEVKEVKEVKDGKDREEKVRSDVEEDRMFLYRNCVELARKIQELARSPMEAGLYVCVEWGVMIQTCPELTPLILSQRLPDSAIVVEFRSMRQLESMRISNRNRRLIQNVNSGEMCIGISTNARPNFRVLTLDANLTNALTNPSLSPSQILNTFSPN